MNGTYHRYQYDRTALYKREMTHFDVLALLVCDHDFDDEVLDVRRNRLLADTLHELAELHRETFLALSCHAHHEQNYPRLILRTID